MEEEELNRENTPETYGDPIPDDSAEIIPTDTETKASDVYEPDPDPEIDPLQENTKTALIIGACLGLAIGVLMFLVPSRILEEGARLTISVILILLGPRLVQDKYHINFRKGRYAMAAALVLVLIIYILVGHPVE